MSGEENHCVGKYLQNRLRSVRFVGRGGGRGTRRVLGMDVTIHPHARDSRARPSGIGATSHCVTLGSDAERGHLWIRDRPAGLEAAGKEDTNPHLISPASLKK